MYFIIIGLVILIFSAVWIIIYWVHRIGKSTVREEQASMNKKINSFLKRFDFKTTKTFYLTDNATYGQSQTCKKFIAVDNDKKQLCLVDYAKASMNIVKFDEILNYEIYENGATATSGGAIGGFWLAGFAANTSQKTKELRLIIRLKKYDVPQVVYNIVSDTFLNYGLDKSTPEFKQCLSDLQEVVSFLEVIKSENAKSNVSEEQSAASSNK